MILDSEYIKELLKIAVEHDGSGCSLEPFTKNNSVDLESNSSVDRFRYHIKILEDYGFVELPVSNKQSTVFGISRNMRGKISIFIGPELRVTALGQEFYTQINDKQIWEKVKPAIKNFGIPVAIELAKAAAMKAVGL